MQSTDAEGVRVRQPLPGRPHEHPDQQGDHRPAGEHRERRPVRHDVRHLLDQLERRNRLVTSPHGRTRPTNGSTSTIAAVAAVAAVAAAPPRRRAAAPPRRRAVAPLRRCAVAPLRRCAG
ncbi:hypothetical protein ITP53_45120 [Nonomuraea sp. K274]|uniref:Uncharacterized protein n=1 Tax=Nonomuraea cypriaca TaxID=1187855 RepID=A0A931AGW4_9ACTN|nr:hypothetical protein [Nonomuraea cypriaca]MBF8192747.1 hypothetical protein [Nonomuraea cypriaca]